MFIDEDGSVMRQIWMIVDPSGMSLDDRMFSSYDGAYKESKIHADPFITTDFQMIDSISERA